MADKSKTIELIITAKDKASSILSGVGGKFGGFAKLAKTGILAVGAAAVAAAGAIATVVVKTLSWGDNLAKTSRTLGLTTEALQGLRTAAGYAGIDVATMDKIVLTMNRNIAEAADGTKAQADALKSIGLSADDLKNAKPEEALAAIVDALNGMDDQAVKTQAAMDLLGRGGAKAFNLTGEAIRGAIKEAKVFGLSLSEADAAAIEEVNDNFSRMKLAIQGAGAAFTVSILPAIKDVAEKIADFAKSGKLREWATLAGTAISDVISGTSALINGFLDSGFGAVVKEYLNNVSAAAWQIKDYINGTDDRKLESLNKRLREIDDQLKGASGYDDSFFGKLAKSGYGVEKLEADKEAILRQINEIQTAGLAEETANFGQELFDKAAAAAKKAAEETDKLAEETANFGQELFDAAKIEHEATKEKEASNKESEKQAQALEKSRQAAEALKLEMAKLASAERIKAMELTVDFKIAEVEENTKRVEAAFESINTSIQSTADVINNTISAMAGLSGGSLFDLQKFDVFKKQLEIENKLRQDTFELQKEETKAVIDAANARRKALENGDAMVKIDGAGLQPHLEAFMFEILSAIQIRVASEGGDVLLGLTEG